MWSCFCVKLCEVEPAAALIKPIVADHTAVISVLDGIDGPLRLARALATGTVFSGGARISAKIQAPGVIAYLGSADRHKLTFGHPTPQQPSDPNTVYQGLLRGQVCR